jgi:hypothetical protein
LELLLREGQERADEHKGEFGYGDVWTWVALDADSKLAVTWLVGDRKLWRTAGASSRTSDSA